MQSESSSHHRLVNLHLDSEKNLDIKGEKGGLRLGSLQEKCHIATVAVSYDCSSHGYRVKKPWV
jgi:hypothetical protein